MDISRRRRGVQRTNGNSLGNCAKPTTHYETKPLTNNHKKDSTDKHTRTGNTAPQAETENAHSPGRSKRTKEKEAERNPGNARGTGRKKKKRCKRKLHQNTNVVPRAQRSAVQPARRMEGDKTENGSERNQGIAKTLMGTDRT